LFAFSDDGPFAYGFVTRIDEFEMKRRQIASRTSLGGEKVKFQSAPAHAVSRAMGGCAGRPAPLGSSFALPKGEFWDSIFPIGLAAGALASVTRFVLPEFGRLQVGLLQKAGATSLRAALAHASHFTAGCDVLTCAKR